MTLEECTDRFKDLLIPKGVDPDHFTFLLEVVHGCKFLRKMGAEGGIDIERGCRPIRSLDDANLNSTTNSTNSNSTVAGPKVYTSYCTTELCNKGDGRKLF